MQAKPFTDVLGEIEAGKLLDELTAKLHTLTRAVVDTRKPGSLKLVLRLSPTGKATVVIAHKVDSVVPNDRLATTFFVGDDGSTLIRDDPRQTRLPLREVPDPHTAPSGSGKLRSVGSD